MVAKSLTSSTQITATITTTTTQQSLKQIDFCSEKKITPAAIRTATVMKEIRK